MNNTILIECNNLASQKTQIYQENNFLEGNSFNEEIFNHKWKTKLPTQITLQPGDEVSLEKSMINSRGQSDETVEMTGRAFIENFKDNEAQMEFGYYINNNMDFNLTLPKIDIGNKTTKDNLQTLTVFKDTAVIHPPVIRPDWVYEKGKVVVPQQTGSEGQIIQQAVSEEVYNWKTLQTGQFYINNETDDKEQAYGFIRKYGSPNFRGTQADYYHIVRKYPPHHGGIDVIEVDKSTSIYKLTEHAPINKLGYNESTCSTNHILLNKPDANTRFYIGKRSFDGFYDDNDFDIKKSRTTLKLSTGFNNPVVISKQLTTQLHQQKSDDFNEPFEMLNYLNSYKTENVSDNSLKVQTTFAGNIFLGQNQNDDKYNFKLPNQNSISTVYDKPDVFRYANREDCENTFWNQLLVGDIKRSIAISRFYGAITSINALDLHNDDDYLSKNFNVMSGLTDIPSSIKKFDEYNADEQPFNFGIQPVLFDDLTSFSTPITEEERTNPKNSYFGMQPSILDKTDLLYLPNTSTKLNLQDGDCIPTNLLATEDNFNRIEQLLRYMEKPSENDLDINLNNQEFKDSLDFHLEYNRIDDAQTHHVLSGVWYKTFADDQSGGGENVWEPDVNTLQKNAFPRIYNLPSPNMTLTGHNPTTSPTNYLNLKAWNRMPVLLGQYIDFPQDFNVDKLKSEISSDRLKVNKIDPVSINTYSRYNENRKPFNNNLRLPTNNFSFTDSQGKYFDDTIIKEKDLGICVAYRDVVSSSIIEQTEVGSYATDKNVVSITATDTLPFGKDEKLIGADAFNPYGDIEDIYGKESFDPLEQKLIHKVQPIDFTGQDLTTLYTLDGGSLAQGTTFSNMLTDNTTQFVSIDTNNGNKLSDTNEIILKITIPEAIDLNGGLGANITHIRLYLAYDTNNDINPGDYYTGGLNINAVGIPTKLRILGEQRNAPGVFNQILPTTDLKTRYLEKITKSNVAAGGDANKLINKNLALYPTLSSAVSADIYYNYIELDVRNVNNYHNGLSRIQFIFLENAMSKFQQRITIKKIEYMSYNTSPQSENVRQDLTLNLNGYSNLKLQQINKLNDNSINGVNSAQFIGGQAEQATSIYAPNLLKQLLPSNTNFEENNLTNADLSIKLRTPYEVGDQENYIICGMGKNLNEEDSQLPVAYYGVSLNMYPTDIQTLPNPRLDVDNRKTIFSTFINTDTNSPPNWTGSYHSPASEPLPHFINFSNKRIKNQKLKIQKIKITNAADYASGNNPALFTNYINEAPRVFAIFGSNEEPDANPRCAFGMNLIYCTATDYNEFLSSLTLTSGVNTTSTLTGFTNNNPQYRPFLTSTSPQTDRIYNYSRTGIIILNDNANEVGLYFDIPESRQAEYRYIRILLFDNNTTTKEFKIGNISVYGARKQDRKVRAIQPLSVPTLPFLNRSIRDFDPQVWINASNSNMNRELNSGHLIRRAAGIYASGSDFQSSIPPDSIVDNPTTDAQGDKYVMVGDIGGTKRFIQQYNGDGQPYDYLENRCSSTLNNNGNYTLVFWVDVPSNITENACLYCEHYFNYRTFRIFLTTDGRMGFQYYQYVNSTPGSTLAPVLYTSTTNQFFGKMKITIERFGESYDTAFLKIYKDDVLVPTTFQNNSINAYYYAKTSNWSIGGRINDNNFEPPTSTTDDAPFKFYGFASFNHQMDLATHSQITTEMLGEPETPLYREVRTSANLLYNDAYVNDINNLLSNDLTQTAKFSLGDDPDLVLWFDLGDNPAERDVKFIDIYPPHVASTNFPSLFIASTTDDGLTFNELGRIYITHTSQNQSHYMTKEDTSYYYRLIVNPFETHGGARRYLRLDCAAITGLTAGNKDTNFVEIAGVRIIGHKTLTASDLPNYHLFYGIHNTADGHITGNIDKFVNGKNDFPNNCLSFKYQFSNSQTAENKDYILENGWKFYDYKIYNNQRGTHFDFEVDLKENKMFAVNNLWFQQDSNFYYPQICDVYGSETNDFATSVAISTHSGIVITTGSNEYNQSSTLLTNGNLPAFNTKGTPRYIRNRFQTMRFDHLIQNPEIKCGGLPGHQLTTGVYTSATYSPYNNTLLLTDGVDKTGNTPSDLFALYSTSGGYIGFEFPSAFVPTEYRIWARGDNNRIQNPKSWEIRASVDKATYDAGTYDVLHTVSNAVFPQKTGFTPTPTYRALDRKDLSIGSYIDTNKSYRYYVIYITANNGHSLLTSLHQICYFGKASGESEEFTLLNSGDLRLGDIEYNAYEGTLFKPITDPDNHIELMYTNHRPTQLNKYYMYPNNVNDTNNSLYFNFVQLWEFYGSNDYRSITENDASYWNLIHFKIQTPEIWDGNYDINTIPDNLIATSGDTEPILDTTYKYYKWRFVDRFETAPSNPTLQYPFRDPRITIGELRLEELQRQNGAATDLTHQPINANIVYEETPAIGQVSTMVDNFGTLFKTSAQDGKFNINFEEDIILTSIKIWGSYNAGQSPTEIFVYRVEEDGTEVLLIHQTPFTSAMPTDGTFLESDIPSVYHQFGTNIPITNTTPSRNYAVDIGVSKEIVEFQMTGKRQEYNLLGSLQQNGMNIVVDTTNTTTNLANLFNNAISQKGTDAYEFSSPTDTLRTIRFDFKKEVRIQRYAFWFNDTTQDYLTRWRIWGSNITQTFADVPNGAILLDDKTDQDYNPSYATGASGIASENLNKSTSYAFNNLEYYRYYFLEAISFDNTGAGELYISELAFYGNENYNIQNVIDNKLGQVAEGLLTDAWIIHKDKAGQTATINIDLKEPLQFNQLRIWAPADLPSNGSIIAPKQFTVRALNESENTVVGQFTNQTYPAYSITDLIDADENLDKSTLFNLTTQKPYQSYQITIELDSLTGAQQYVAIAELAFYRAEQASRKDVPFICFISKSKQDHNGALQLTPQEGEMIGISRSLQNNKWGHVMTTKPSDLPQLATGIDGISFNNTLTASTPFGTRTLKDFNNNYNEDDPLHYSQNIMVGSENVNFSFDTDLARISLKEMNTAMQQGQNLSDRLRYEDYRTAQTGDDVEKKDSEANTQVVKINPRKYSVNSAKYGSSFDYLDNNRISFHYPFNCGQILPQDPEIGVKTLFYLANQQGEGIFSSQTGIGLLNLYVGKQDGTYQKLTLDNKYEYKNTLFDKLGFKLDQLISKYGNQNSYFNRHNQNLYIDNNKNALNKYNNLTSPLTNNAYIDGTLNTTLDSASEWNFPIGKLGLSGTETVNSSYIPDELIAQNKPSKYDYSHILLYSDIVPKYDYVGTNQSLAIPCIAHLDRQYETGDFQFGEAGTFRYIVDYPMTLSEINVDLRLADGRPAPIDENSTIIFRIDKRRPAPLQLINQTSQK
jgi:hypothetical protein